MNETAKLKDKTTIFRGQMQSSFEKIIFCNENFAKNHKLIADKSVIQILRNMTKQNRIIFYGFCLNSRYGNEKDAKTVLNYLHELCPNIKNEYQNYMQNL